MSKQGNKSREIAGAYANWAGSHPSVVFIHGDEVLLATPYMLPGGHDEAITIVVRATREKLYLRDGGQLVGYLWSHGIDLANRKDATHRIESILATAGMRLENGEFYMNGLLSEANMLIHSFGAELLAVASQMYSLQSDYGFEGPATRSSRAATLLKEEIRKAGLQVWRYRPSDGKPEKGRLYSHMPRTVSGMEHTFDFYVENGRSYSVDCIDFASMITGARARNKTFEAVAIHQNIGEESHGWDYQVAYTEPTIGQEAMGGDPLKFLDDSGIKLVPLFDAESRGLLAQKLTSVARQGSLL